eukprot:TRINITY_DN8174_c0_g1_i1.p1 TRINITY_DN8174_c0_g1~~TRINITY_DN8174_c0_g1_i1.p1  ORF type:complete len:647 (+),score=128.46 TRINITY_DN8174_c0_g1_i1:145-2085(+)
MSGVFTLSGLGMTHRVEEIPTETLDQTIASTDAAMKQLATDILFGKTRMQQLPLKIVSRTADNSHHLHTYLLSECETDTPINETLPYEPLTHVCKWLFLYIVRCQFPDILINSVIITPYVHRQGSQPTCWSLTVQVYRNSNLDIDLSNLQHECDEPIPRTVTEESMELLPIASDLLDSNQLDRNGDGSNSEKLVVDADTESVLAELQLFQKQLQKQKQPPTPTDSPDTKRLKAGEIDCEAELPTGIENVHGIAARIPLNQLSQHSFVELHDYIYDYNKESIVMNKNNPTNKKTVIEAPADVKTNEVQQQSDESASLCDVRSNSHEGSKPSDLDCWELLPSLSVLNEGSTSSECGDDFQILNKLASNALVSVFDKIFGSKQETDVQPTADLISISTSMLSTRDSIVVLHSGDDDGCENGDHLLIETEIVENCYSELGLGRITFVRKIPTWLLSQIGEVGDVVRYLNQKSIQTSARRVIQMSPSLISQRFDSDSDPTCKESQERSIPFLCLRIWLKSSNGTKTPGGCIILTSLNRHVKVWMTNDEDRFLITNFYSSDAACSKEAGALVVLRAETCFCIRISTVGLPHYGECQYLASNSHVMRSLHIFVGNELLVLSSPELNQYCEFFGHIAAAVAFLVQHDVILPLES